MIRYDLRVVIEDHKNKPLESCLLWAKIHESLEHLPRGVTFRVQKLVEQEARVSKREKK